MDDEDHPVSPVLISDDETYHVVGRKSVGSIYAVLKKGCMRDVKGMPLVNKETGHFEANLH